MTDKTLGLISLINSFIFFGLGFLKVATKPINEILYSSKATVAIYLILAIVLLTFSIYFLRRTKRSKQNKLN